MTHIILTISGPSQRCGPDSSCVCNNLCKMELLENYRRIQRIIGKIIDMLSKVKHRRSGSNSSSNNICKIIDMENRKLSKNIKNGWENQTLSEIIKYGRVPYRLSERSWSNSSCSRGNRGCRDHTQVSGSQHQIYKICKNKIYQHMFYNNLTYKSYFGLYSVWHADKHFKAILHQGMKIKGKPLSTKTEVFFSHTVQKLQSPFLQFVKKHPL